MKDQNFNAENLLKSAFTGLNEVTENTEAIAEMLDTYGLRWKVEKQLLCLADGTPTSFYGVVRQDTKKAFTTCKEGYTPYQNEELAELLLRVSEKTGYTLHNGGGFNGGAKVFIQLDTGNKVEGLGENQTNVKGYITALNGHDGTCSLKWGHCSLTICCENTFAYAKTRLEYSARHTTNIHDKVAQSLASIEKVMEDEKTLFQEFIQLADTPVKSVHIAQIVHGITGVNIDLPKSQTRDEYSSYQLNRTTDLLRSIQHEMSYKGQSLWGLFSGVTHYTSHRMPAPKRYNGRLESKFIGTGQEIDNAAFHTSIAFC